MEIKGDLSAWALSLKAGTATQAPIQLTSGTNLTTATDGCFEYNGSHIYFTVGTTRYQLDQQSTSAAAGGSNTQLQYNNGGVLGGTSGLTWDNVGGGLTLLGSFDCGTIEYSGNLSISAYYNGGATGYLHLYSDFAILFDNLANMQSNALYLDTSQAGWLYADGAGTFEIHSDTGGGGGTLQLYADDGLGGSIGLNSTTISLNGTTVNIGVTTSTINVGGALSTVNIGSKAKVDSKGVISSATPAAQVFQAQRFGGF